MQLHLPAWKNIKSQTFLLTFLAERLAHLNLDIQRSKNGTMDVKEMLNLARIPSILLLGLIYMAYVLIGGLVFWSLEGDLGRKDITVLLRNRNRLLKTYTCLKQEGLEDVAQVRQ